MMKSAFMTDKDVMSVLMISRKTLAAIMRGERSSCGLDLRKIEPIIVTAGRKRGQRRWSLSKFSQVTGISREEIWDAIS